MKYEIFVFDDYKTNAVSRGKCLSFLKKMHGNESYEREAKTTDLYRPQEMTTQAHQAFRWHCLGFEQQSAVLYFHNFG